MQKETLLQVEALVESKKTELEYAAVEMTMEMQLETLMEEDSEKKKIMKMPSPMQKETLHQVEALDSCLRQEKKMPQEEVQDARTQLQMTESMNKKEMEKERKKKQ
jgi:hypothetical protein